MSRQLKLTAAVAVVLVALSGFSPGRKGGGHHRSSGKSGGCSSSRAGSHNSGGSSHDSVSKGGHHSDGGSYRGSRRYNNTTGTTGSRSGSAGTGSPSGTVTRCAARSGSEARAVVEVRNPKSSTRNYQVKVRFVDSTGLEVDSGQARVAVGSRDTESVDVRMAHPKRIGDVSECLVEWVR